jgi:hypothetical protein
MIMRLRMFRFFQPMVKEKIGLGEPNEYPTVIENRRMARADLVTAPQRVFEHRSRLLRKWEEIHG